MPPICHLATPTPETLTETYILNTLKTRIFQGFQSPVRVYILNYYTFSTNRPCGDYCVDTKEKLVEILYFRHFAKHFVFSPEGKNSRNKHLKNYFDVSVVVDIGCGNTNGN